MSDELGAVLVLSDPKVSVCGERVSADRKVVARLSGGQASSHSGSRERQRFDNGW